MKYVLSPCDFQNVDYSTVVQIKNINATAKFCNFLNDINFNRLQITLDERELCFQLQNRCLVKNQTFAYCHSP